MNEYLIKLKNFTLDFWQDNDVRIYLLVLGLEERLDKFGCGYCHRE